MELKDADPEPIKVLDYDFNFVDRSSLEVTVFPSLGDSCEQMQTEWVFQFPRLGTKQYVYKAHVKGYTLRESMRVYMDPVELRKRVKQQQDDAKATRDTAKAS